MIVNVFYIILNIRSILSMMIMYAFRSNNQRQVGQGMNSYRARSPNTPPSRSILLGRTVFFEILMMASILEFRTALQIGDELSCNKFKNLLGCCMSMISTPRNDEKSFSHCPGPTFDPWMLTAFPIDSIETLIIRFFSVQESWLVYQECIAMFAFNEGGFFTKFLSASTRFCNNETTCNMNILFSKVVFRRWMVMKPSHFSQ